MFFTVSGSWYIDLGFFNIRTGKYAEETLVPTCINTNSEGMKSGDNYIVEIQDRQCHTFQNIITVENLNGIPAIGGKDLKSYGNPDIWENDEYIFEITAIDNLITVKVIKK